jgi:hypothetical protein
MFLTFRGIGFTYPRLGCRRCRRFYGILDGMRSIRLACLLIVGASCAGCFQMATVMKVNGDGSGTVEHRMLFTAQALAQLRQFSALGGSRGQAVDPTSEQQAREMASALGPGVTYVSSSPITTPTGQGRDAIYAFTDVNQVRVAAQPAAPGGATIKAQGLSTHAEMLTFSMTREPSGNMILHIRVPEPALVEALGSNAASAPQQIAMVRTLLAGAHVTLGVEPAGQLVRTSSPYVDGPRVTLLEVDLDQVLKDETLVARVQAAKTPEDLKAALKDVPGLKVTLDPEITIEFTPAR